MAANKLTVFVFFLLFYLKSSVSPVPQFCLPFLSICLSLPDQEDDAKVKTEEEPAPLTQLAHSSTLEQEVCPSLPSFVAVYCLLSVFKNFLLSEK